MLGAVARVGRRSAAAQPAAASLAGFAAQAVAGPPLALGEGRVKAGCSPLWLEVGELSPLVRPCSAPTVFG
ncbi:MAG: hypothetical protein ACK56F_10250 [bacterium]